MDVRINKFLSEAGLCSRREADRLIEQRRVHVNGVPASQGQKVQDGDTVCVDGKEITKETQEIILAFYKPRGVVCTTAREDNAQDIVNVVDYINYPKRIYPVGRLDKDSEGLLLLTNQGALMDEILRSRNHHEKEYFVTVDHDMTKEFLEKMASGVHLFSMRNGQTQLDEMTRPCKVQKVNERSFRIILTQGLNRQIRRMCETLGYRVRYLRRDRVLNISLGNLKKGAYRELTVGEKEELYRIVGKKREK